MLLVDRFSQVVSPGGRASQSFRWARKREVCFHSQSARTARAGARARGPQACSWATWGHHGLESEVGPGSCGGRATVCVCVPFAVSRGSCSDWTRSPGVREPPRGLPVGAGSPGTLTASFLLGPYEPWTITCGPRGVCVCGVCVYRAAALALDGAQKPAQGQGLPPGAAASGGRAGQGGGARPPASPQPRPTGGRGGPHRGCPRLPPASCLRGADPELHASAH